MIKAREAIRTARALLGTPYSELDCINLIKRVIRTAPGGVPGYRTAGTNSLWRSAESAAKYRDLTWRQEGLEGARAGMLAFKRDGENIHHVGLVTGEGTVIHSSSAKGCVVETELGSTWQLLARHRYIGVEDAEPSPLGRVDAEGGRVRSLYIVCAKGGLRMRKKPSAKGKYMQMIPDGTRVTALDERDGWIRCAYRGHVGWVSGAYCCLATGND